MTATPEPAEQLNMAQGRGMGWIMSLSQPCPQLTCHGTVTGMAKGAGPNRPKMAQARGRCDVCRRAFGMYFEGDWSVECRKQNDRP